jgi:hypothetical protein
MRIAIDHPGFTRALTLADFVPVQIEVELGGAAMATCMYVDPDNNRCQKDAKFEILEASNELHMLTCEDHEETVRLAAEGRQAHALGVSDPPIPVPSTPPAQPPGTASIAPEPPPEDPGI